MRMKARSASIQPGFLRQHDGGLDLAFGDGPIPAQQDGHLVPRDDLEPVLAIELDGPLSGCPCADEKRSRCLGPEVVQQPATDAAPAVGGSDIGVTDERYVLHILQTHDPEQLTVLLETPEPDPMLDLMLQLLARHVRVLEPVVGMTPL
jgi:hypothetical protein